jgi:hypothetical protein
MRINSLGNCNANQNWAEDRARREGISPGHTFSSKCEICGRTKSQGNHQRCSRLKQLRFVK